MGISDFLATLSIGGIKRSLAEAEQRGFKPIARRSMGRTTDVQKEVVLKNEKREAAVLVPLCKVNGEWSVLFTKRSETVGTHKGQVSFPGGMKDSTDVDVISCALRELEEEVGFAAEQVQVLGLSHPARAITGVHVSPVVGYLGEVNAREVWFEKAEIAEVFTLTFADLLHPEKRYEQTFSEGKLPVFDAGPYPVWGLTAYILNRFFEDLAAPLSSKTELIE